MCLVLFSLLGVYSAIGGWNIKTLEKISKKGKIPEEATGFEPVTRRSAVECFTTQPAVQAYFWRDNAQYVLLRKICGRHLGLSQQRKVGERKN